MKKLLYLIPLVLILGVAAYWMNSRRADAITPDALLVPLAAEQDLAGFALATEPNSVQFPRDLGAHPDYQTEWWYYTGNLQTENGRLFGYQFTIFRRALTPPPLDGETAVSDSDWRTNQLYFAHFTISDIENDTFYPHERFSRGAFGLAGAESQPYRVWLEDWSATEIGADQVRIVANADDVALDIVLTQTLPPILHGEGGLSQKGPGVGNASYYYSFVQQRTEGTIQIGTETFSVTGKSWKDHEYSTSALGAEAEGWDWFSLQFDNGESLMIVEIRQTDGSKEPLSYGTFISADGQTTPLKLEDWTLTVTDRWQSPNSGAEYPAGWELEIPSLEISLSGAPLIEGQELLVSTQYWEGAIRFSGTVRGEPITALGYVEMTGYASRIEL